MKIVAETLDWATRIVGLIMYLGYLFKVLAPLGHFGQAALVFFIAKLFA